MGEAGSPKNSHDATVEATLSAAEIQKLEQDINDHKGIWLYFDKLPPAEEDAAAKGGKPPAGKPGAKPGGATEEMKPVNGRAWIDLTQFSDPTQPTQLLRQRFAIQTVAKPPVEGAEPNPLDNIFEQQQTYIMVSVSLQEPVYPSADNQEDFEKREYENKIASGNKLPSTNQAIADFNAQLDFICKEISAEYTRVFNGVATKEEKNASP